MAKFKFIQWIYDFLLSENEFIFEWDDGNSSKSFEKHGVDCDAVESVFSDKDLLSLGVQTHPHVTEARYGIIGKSFSSGILFICFTVRGNKIRPISSRLANKKEKDFYEKEIC